MNYLTIVMYSRKANGVQTDRQSILQRRFAPKNYGEEEKKNSK